MLHGGTEVFDVRIGEGRTGQGRVAGIQAGWPEEEVGHIGRVRIGHGAGAQDGDGVASTGLSETLFGETSSRPIASSTRPTPGTVRSLASDKWQTPALVPFRWDTFHGGPRKPWGFIGARTT